MCDLLCVSVCEYISYLSFRQTEVDSQFRFPPDGDVSVEMKLLLQLQSLMVSVDYPVFLLRSRFTCEEGKKNMNIFGCPFLETLASSQVVELEHFSRGGCMHATTGLIYT